jgi:hypothetical protein
MMLDHLEDQDSSPRPSRRYSYRAITPCTASRVRPNCEDGAMAKKGTKYPTITLIPPLPPHRPPRARPCTTRSTRARSFAIIGRASSSMSTWGRCSGSRLARDSRAGPSPSASTPTPGIGRRMAHSFCMQHQSFGVHHLRRSTITGRPARGLEVMARCTVAL